MVSIRAYFDGKVFVPQETVNLPANTRLRLDIALEQSGPAQSATSDEGERFPLRKLLDAAKSVPDSDDWPADFASEVDHYLYGTPKRNGIKPDTSP